VSAETAVRYGNRLERIFEMTTLYVEENYSPPVVAGETWSAVGSMALCVTLLIAAEFMPVSLLTPIAQDLNATVGMAGQAISISGLFAVVTSLLIATVAGPA
jgi:predicted MFS family arabinose efflux permease